MKIGPPPLFAPPPDQEQWAKIEGTDLSRWEVALSLGVLAFGLAAFGWWAVTGQRPALFAEPFLFGFALFAFGLLVHELVHYFALPAGAKGGGIWPAKGVCYVYFHGTMSRTRAVLVYLLPFLLITVAPLCIAALGVEVPWWIQFISIWNALGSCFDLQHTWWLLRKSGKNDEILWGNRILWYRTRAAGAAGSPAAP